MAKRKVKAKPKAKKAPVRKGKRPVKKAPKRKASRRVKPVQAPGGWPSAADVVETESAPDTPDVASPLPGNVEPS